MLPELRGSVPSLRPLLVLVLESVAVKEVYMQMMLQLLLVWIAFILYLFVGPGENSCHESDKVTFSMFKSAGHHFCELCMVTFST